MANDNKQRVHRWIRLGTLVLDAANTFFRDFADYNVRCPPNQLAMTAGEAESMLECLDTIERYLPRLRSALKERIRISERQGPYSLERKAYFQNVPKWGGGVDPVDPA